MGAFFAEFRIIGEVVDYRYVQSPCPKLLIDISIEEPGRPDSGLTLAPARIATEIGNDFLAGRFLRDVAIGDAIEITGTFSQTGYMPHDLTYVDTIFAITAYRPIGLDTEQSVHTLSMPRSHAIH